VFYKGQYFQLGDVVSLSDEGDELYFAQITGLMQDHNYEKSATIAWLLPNKPSTEEFFAPDNYLLGEIINH